MWHAIGQRSPFGLARLGPFPVVSVVLVAAGFGFATYGLGRHAAAAPARPDRAPAVRAQSIHGAAPDAREFARELVGMTNQFAAQQGDNERLGNVDCVQATRGHYMCSFAVLRPAQPAECHIIQAIWTPAAVDSFK